MVASCFARRKCLYVSDERVLVRRAHCEQSMGYANPASRYYESKHFLWRGCRCGLHRTSRAWQRLGTKQPSWIRSGWKHPYHLQLLIRRQRLPPVAGLDHLHSQNTITTRTCAIVCGQPEAAARITTEPNRDENEPLQATASQRYVSANALYSPEVRFWCRRRTFFS